MAGGINAGRPFGMPDGVGLRDVGSRIGNGLNRIEAPELGAAQTSSIWSKPGTTSFPAVTRPSEVKRVSLSGRVNSGSENSAVHSSRASGHSILDGPGVRSQFDFP